MATYEDFQKIEIKIGEIISAQKIEGSEKLLLLSVDFAEEIPRQVVSGISKYFEDPNILVGKKCSFVTNLEPRKLMGYESQAMIMAAHDGDEKFSLLEVPSELNKGAKIN